MSTIQLHAVKLWFAAHAGNWKLAGYELDELAETVDAAELLHAKRITVDITAVLESVRQTQIPLVKQAIAQKDFKTFTAGYQQTLAACNGCHRSAGYPFIHIIPPTGPPVTNQQFSVDTSAPR